MKTFIKTMQCSSCRLVAKRGRARTGNRWTWLEWRLAIHRVMAANGDTKHGWDI